MAEFSQFWDTTGVGDGLVGGYTENDWIEFYQTLFIPEIMSTAGVLPRSGNKLAVTGTTNANIQVATGRAIIYGFLYKNTTALAVPALTIPVVGTTGFRIVLRANHAAQTVRVAVLMSADGVAAIPAATQSAGTTWEVSLATGTITTLNVVTLTDTRAYTKFNTMIDNLHLDTSVADNSTLELAGGSLRVKDSGITAAKIAAAVAGNGLAGGAGSALSVNVDNSTIEINTDTLRVKDAGITAAKIAAAVAGNGLSGGAGSALAVNVDNSSIEINADILRVKALGIALSMLAADSVDDTKIGSRVLGLTRRQGGDPTHWSSSGATNYTPTNVRAQAGTRAITLTAASLGSVVITLPVAFSAEPLILTGVYFSTMNTPYEIVANVTSTSQFTLIIDTFGVVTTGTVNVNWLALGAE